VKPLVLHVLNILSTEIPSHKFITHKEMKREPLTEVPSEQRLKIAKHKARGEGRRTILPSTLPVQRDPRTKEQLV